MHILYVDDYSSVDNPNKAHFVLAGIALFERGLYHQIKAADDCVASFNLGDPHQQELTRVLYEAIWSEYCDSGLELAKVRLTDTSPRCGDARGHVVDAGRGARHVPAAAPSGDALRHRGALGDPPASGVRPGAPHRRALARGGGAGRRGRSAGRCPHRPGHSRIAPPTNRASSISACRCSASTTCRTRWPPSRSRRRWACPTTRSAGRWRLRRRQAALHQDRRGARHHRDRRLRPPSGRDRRRPARRAPGLWRLRPGDRRHAAAPLHAGSARSRTSSPPASSTPTRC